MAEPHPPTTGTIELPAPQPAQPGATPPEPPRTPSERSRRRRWARRLALPAALVFAAGLVVLALSRLDLHSVGHSLASANFGWIVAAVALMSLSLVLRAISWRETLKAAIADFGVGFAAVLRATVIGVLVSALLPGRMGEPSRSLLISKRLGSARRYFSVVLGTVFSQTVINLIALVGLAAITFTRVPLFRGREGGLLAAVIVPLTIIGLALGAPRLLRLVARSRSERLRRAALWTSAQLVLVRQGLAVFARPRHGAPAVAAQLCAWVLQWLACYAVMLALHFGSHATLVTAAAILLAVNVSAILPATPSNVGVFQAACLVVLAAFGFGAGVSLAYGILLQAVEVVTAVGMGVPSLLGEGLSWNDLSRMRRLDDSSGVETAEAAEAVEAAAAASTPADS
jgi:phosphatidylinositol alpha-mannosyltransferase